MQHVRIWVENIQKWIKVISTEHKEMISCCVVCFVLQRYLLKSACWLSRQLAPARPGQLGLLAARLTEPASMSHLVVTQHPSFIEYEYRWPIITICKVSQVIVHFMLKTVLYQYHITNDILYFWFYYFMSEFVQTLKSSAYVSKVKSLSEKCVGTIDIKKCREVQHISL